MESSAEKNGFWKRLFSHPTFVIGVGVIVILVGMFRWTTLPSDGRHFWPITAEDWAAWGTWAGAFGAVAALYFAARSVQHAIAAQTHQKEQNELDREERQKQHDKEVALHQEMKNDRDTISRNYAKQLTWSVTTYVPRDAGYLDPEDGPVSAEHGDHEEPQENPADYTNTSLYVVISNTSEKTIFADVSLRLPNPKERAKIVRVLQRTPLPDTPQVVGEWLPGSPPEWGEREIQSIFPPDHFQMSLGTIAPQSQIKAILEFVDPQHWLQWEGNMGTYKRDGNLILTFRDPEDRYWLRSTHAADDDVFRSWHRIS